MLSLNLPVDKSDISFSKFGIDSKRTPDLIMKVDKTLLIFEISASSNFENAARMKGLDEYGFESKYQRELDILIDLNVPHLYLPVIFDMSDQDNCSYLDQIKKVEGLLTINKQYIILLKVIYESLCQITKQMRDYITPSSILLFSTYIPIEKNHDSMSFLYENNRVNDVVNHYKEFYVSVPTYRKIHSNWSRLPKFIDRLKVVGSKKEKKDMSY